MHCRVNEEEKHWYRSDRFFIANSKWYFSTRENVDIGPFTNIAAAKHGLAIFIKTFNSGDYSFQHAANAAQQGAWSKTLYH